MKEQKLISFDLRADFAFFKKPDVNDGIQLSYNMLHKPALLGIMGAIVGLAGYQKKGTPPEYYVKLKDIPVGIAPLEGMHDKGNFQKANVLYTNTVGYANKGSNQLIEESILIRPGYRCYLLLSLDSEEQLGLYEHLRGGTAVYVPYLGKNEFQAWFNDSFQEYDYVPFIPKADFSIYSLFIKEGIIKEKKVRSDYSFLLAGMANASSFCYFERLPTGFDERLNQYVLGEFVYTDWTLKQDAIIRNLYKVKNEEGEKIIQLF